MARDPRIFRFYCGCANAQAQTAAPNCGITQLKCLFFTSQRLPALINGLQAVYGHVPGRDNTRDSLLRENIASTLLPL